MMALSLLDAAIATIEACPGCDDGDCREHEVLRAAVAAEVFDGAEAPVSKEPSPGRGCCGNGSICPECE